MYCIYILTIASLKIFIRNRQAMFFSLFMPMVILFIFGSMNFDKPGHTAVGVVTHHPPAAITEFLKHMRENAAVTINEGGLDEELADLHKGDIAAVIDVPDDLLMPALGPPRELTLYVNQSRPIEAGMVLSMLNGLVDKATIYASGVKPLFAIKQESVNSRNTRYIDFLLPGVTAMAIMQMGVFSVAFVFAQYREKGILKRLMATPVRPFQFVTANIITRLIMSMVQASILIATSMAIFHVHIVGSLGVLSLCVAMGAVMFLGLGFTISGLAKSVETVPVLANIVVFPMLFVGNVFFPASNLPGWLQIIADNLPLTFFAKALRSVMVDGEGIAGVRNDLAGMAVWAIIMVTLATFTFRFQERESM